MNLSSPRAAGAAAVLAVAAILLTATVVAGISRGRHEAQPRAGVSSGASSGTSSSPASGQQSATRIRDVTPLAADGRLDARYRLAGTHHGYCWTTSFVLGRAYRCLQHNLILDPCWKETRRATVVCLVYPWSTRAYRLKLTRPLPGATEQPGALWGLQVGGPGVRCLISMGASGVVGKHPVTYVCSHRWVLLGEPDRSGPTWTILTARRVRDHYVVHGRVPVTTAWRPVAR